MVIYYTKHTRDKNDPCTNQMKAFLTTANGCTNWYDYKWILPNILKASTGFHLVYIAASTLLDIKERIRRSKEGNVDANLQSGKSCFYEPILLFLLHLAAVVISSTNFFVEQDVKNWCCRVFPFAEVWLTLILPLLLVIALTFVIYKKAGDLTAESDNSETKVMESVKMFGSMVAARFLCYFTLIVKWHFCGTNSFTWSLMAQALVQINSFMNPFIYVFQVNKGIWVCSNMWK